MIIALKKDNKLAIYRDNLKTKPNLSNPIEYVMSNPNTESEVMQSLDIPYYRITQTDHLSPTVENINRLVFLYDTVLKNTPKQWVYLHCAGGKGRTTTVTAMLVMLKQQDKHQLQPFSELISAVKSMSNQYSLMPFCKKSDKAYLCQAQWQRYETLAKFYQFVKTRLPNETYSQWLIRNSSNN